MMQRDIAFHSALEAAGTSSPARQGFRQRAFLGLAALLGIG
jgi:hypothetical protein